MVLNDVQVKKMEKNLNDLGRSAVYSEYSHSVVLTGLNCKENSSTFKSGTDYSKNDIVINSWDFGSQQQDFSPVLPDSSDETFLNYVCQYVDAKKMTKRKRPLQTTIPDRGPITKSPGGLSGFDDLYRH
jgi:hypothetical protein